MLLQLVLCASSHTCRMATTVFRELAWAMVAPTCEAKLLLGNWVMSCSLSKANASDGKRLVQNTLLPCPPCSTSALQRPRANAGAPTLAPRLVRSNLGAQTVGPPTVALHLWSSNSRSYLWRSNVHSNLSAP